MKKLFLLLISIIITGCSTNGYRKYSDIYIDLNNPMQGKNIISLKNEDQDPKVIEKNNLNSKELLEYCKEISSLGFVLIGSSEFEGGTNVYEYQALEVGRELNAKLIIVSSEYVYSKEAIGYMSVPKTSYVNTTGNVSTTNLYNYNQYNSNINLNTQITTYEDRYYNYTINRYNYTALYFSPLKQSNEYKIGINIRELDLAEKNKNKLNYGLEILTVYKNSPAYYKDLFSGDIILKMNNIKLFDIKDYDRNLKKNGNKKPIKLTILRKNKIKTIYLKKEIFKYDNENIFKN